MDERGFTGGLPIVRDEVRSAELHGREMLIALTQAPGDCGEVLLAVARMEQKAHHLNMWGFPVSLRLCLFS